MRLLAISDLHLSNTANRDALAALPSHPDDWLILAGDVAERLPVIAEAFAMTTARFRRVIWVPGNHELWRLPDEPFPSHQTKYQALVDLARQHGVITPEDPFPLWDGPGGPCLIAPLFLLYDYSFRPDDVPLDGVLAWAEEGRAVCTDELLLDSAPYPSRSAWCEALCAAAEARLAATDPTLPKIIINHYPLRRDLVHIPRVPRFTPWCGTRRTEDWHRRFNVKVAVSGHLHVRRTDWRDGTRFEEVSLGYPRQWDPARGMAHYLRQIMPGPTNSERLR